MQAAGCCVERASVTLLVPANTKHAQSVPELASFTLYAAFGPPPRRSRAAGVAGAVAVSRRRAERGIQCE